jgi:hypothetical protein
MANKTMSKEVNEVCNVDFLSDSRYFYFKGGLSILYIM